ncbi:MAG: thiamine-monophosphate kinase [Frankiales bacterium]|nr:thiamine-monophosphate kinase [Frankiales bacterium]
MSIRRCAITVSDAGEFGLIARVTSRLPQGAQVIVGPGDDAAVVAAPDHRVVISTDLLVEGRHFRRDWSSATDIGHKAAAQSLADIAAMGATATAIVVGLAAPDDLPLEWADELTDGLRAECDRTGASVVGGDVVAAPLVLISVTALGDLTGQAPVLRSGAQPGDVVVCTGGLGASTAGLRALQSGDAGNPHVRAHLRPRPPYSLGPALARAGATSMVDTSDGLLADLGHVATASGVGIELELALVRTAAADGVEDADALTGGEDHALVATLPALASVPRGCSVIGRVVVGSGVRVDGAEWSGAAGWEHYR